jgi:hypothetical protein
MSRFQPKVSGSASRQKKCPAARSRLRQRASGVSDSMFVVLVLLGLFLDTLLKLAFREMR